MSQRDIVRDSLFPYQQKFYDALMSGEFKMNIPMGRSGRAIMGVDFSNKPDMAAVQMRTGTMVVMTAGKDMLEIDQPWINARNANRTADREVIAQALTLIAGRHGAKIERRDEPAIPGYSGKGIALRFELAGVGAMVDVDNLHGGEWVLISWHNTEHPARNFTTRFCVAVGDHPPARPHHKATSQPANWYSLAKMLDAGLMLAVRGAAFVPQGA